MYVQIQTLCKSVTQVTIRVATNNQGWCLGQIINSRDEYNVILSGYEATHPHAGVNGNTSLLENSCCHWHPHRVITIPQRGMVPLMCHNLVAIYRVCALSQSFFNPSTASKMKSHIIVSAINGKEDGVYWISVFIVPPGDTLLAVVYSHSLYRKTCIQEPGEMAV